MKINNRLLISTSLIFSLNLYAGPQGEKVIYGEDNRKDVFETTNASFLELSKSTAAMIHGTDLRSLGRGEIEINGKSLYRRGICTTERFAQQMSVANCSGFLVSPNKLVTAGHCIKNDMDCSTYNWVFDFKMDNAFQKEMTVPASSVYSCKRIISRKLESSSQDDYAVIELDRKVLDRRYLKVRRYGKPSKGDDLVVIGHPSGLPTKIADGAKVRSLGRKFFVANLDTYGGNSGSAVFNVKTEEVEGILVRGETDYIVDTARGCQVSKVCLNDACRGEDVTYITNVPGLGKIH